MSTEIVNTKSGEITEIAAFTPEQTELLKRTVGKDFTDDEFMVFLNVCKKVQLDPFSKQIYAIKYGGRMTIQTSIDGLRLVADRTKNYAPGKAPTFTYKSTTLSLQSATAYVMKCVGGTWFEVSATAHIDEYMNPVNQLWKKLPHAMLAKCAESQALRRAFPNETSGLYTTEEMSQAEKPTIKMPTEKPNDETAAPAPTPAIEFPSAGPVESVPVDLPLGEPPVDETPKQSKFFKKLHQVAREKGLDQGDKMKAAIKILFNKESSKDLTDEECAKLISQIEKGAIRNG